MKLKGRISKSSFVFIAVFSLLAVTSVGLLQAAPPQEGVEGESFSFFEGVSSEADSTASGGFYVQFPEPYVPPPPPPQGDEQFNNIPSNFNTDDYLIPGWGQTPGYPAFRTFCTFSHLAYADPILSPGNPNFYHLHMFFGNVQADQNSTYTSLRSSGDSTCQGGPINRTSYWAPAVFDSQNRVVTPNHLEIYYKAENASSPSILQPFPNGLRLVAGWGPDRFWSLQNQPPGSGVHTQRIEREPGIGGRMRIVVRFPYCWDGQNLWLPYGAHMSYGTDGGTWGPCPSSHPIHLPEITEHIAFTNVHEDTRNWYLSSDRMDPSNPQPNFSTLHMDWFGAWDNTIQDWTVDCLRASIDTSGGNLCAIFGRPNVQLRPLPFPDPTFLTGWSPTP